VMVSGALPEPGLSVETLGVLFTLLDELPLKQAVQLAAKITGASRNELYQRALKIKNPA
jgi:16S rRNA (cytidine1402-2'-O)-methyltransferase